MAKDESESEKENVIRSVFRNARLFSGYGGSYLIAATNGGNKLNQWRWYESRDDVNGDGET